MRTIAWIGVFAAFLPAFGQQPPATEQADSCIECHKELEDALGRPAQVFENDIHRQSGLSCTDCHGGDPTSLDPEISMSPSKGFVGKIARQQTPKLCGGCHSNPNVIHKFKPRQRVDQLVQYRTSVHGQRLASGDLKAANCVDCHGVHEIREVRHPLSPVYPTRMPFTCARCHADAEHMEGHSIPTNQFEQYQRSVHWQAVQVRGDLSAPTCPTCHGNHSAKPPHVDDVAQVCGACHVVFQQAFNQSPHKPAFDQMGLAECVACHGNHEVLSPGDEMLGVGEGAVCASCHSEGERAYVVARSMGALIEGLRQALTQSKQVLDQAEESGMEVSEGQLQWTSANEELIKARVQVHSFGLGPISEAVEKGLKLASSSHQVGAKSLEEREFRRKGLALSLVTIAIAMAGLWLAVRSLESPDNLNPPQ